MGYAGYAPGFRAPPKPSELQLALKQIKSVEAFETLSKLLRNIVVNPTEEKFRKIRLSNPKINSVIVQTPGAVETLLAMGWVYADGDIESLMVPKGRQITMAEVRMVEDAKDAWKKNARTAIVRNAKKAAVSEEQRALQAQLDADRRERAAAAPITKGSIAQQLPAEGGGMMSGGDCFSNGCDC